MSTKIRIVLAQLNLTVGSIQANLKKLMDAAHEARDQLKATCIVFPELSLTGYLHEDLVYRQAFVEEALQALNSFKQQVKGIYCVVGHPLPADGRLWNACSVIYDGEIIGQSIKQNLPNYSVFDESRYYVPGTEACVVPIAGVPVGITICEDLWSAGPIQKAAAKGARLILSPNASPFAVKKYVERENILKHAAKSVNMPIFYVNLICGQDELVFDGGSMVIDAEGQCCQRAAFFKELLFPVDVEIGETDITVAKMPVSQPSKEELIYEALVLGTREYVQKNQFSGALIGLSGGIDSALTLTIAVDALGKENVHGVLLPSRFTADISNEDAIALANNMGITYESISIEPAFNSFLNSLSLTGRSDLTTENIQSRCRGLILMALSNQTGKIVLTTGNHSEMAVGYTTLYGDMAGGFAVLKDVPKTVVYELARYRNRIAAVIPQRIFDRPPTAELAAGQKDQDTLPPYEILDVILELYINQELSIADIVALGHEKSMVVDVVKKIKKSEYKRRQAPIGIRIKNNAFGRDRRYPVTSGFDQ